MELTLGRLILVGVFTIMTGYALAAFHANRGKTLSLPMLALGLGVFWVGISVMVDVVGGELKLPSDAGTATLSIACLSLAYCVWKYAKELSGF